VPPLVYLDGAAVRVFGHRPAAPGHLFVPGQHRRLGPGQRLNRAIQGLNVKAREQTAAAAALAGPARCFGWIDREMHRPQFGGEMQWSLAVVLVL